MAALFFGHILLMNLLDSKCTGTSHIHCTV